MSKAHPGFKSVQSSIAKKQGISSERAGAILGAASRGASAAAKKANPRLKRVKGKMHHGGVIPENGLYEMEEGEEVIPMKKKIAKVAHMMEEEKRGKVSAEEPVKTWPGDSKEEYNESCCPGCGLDHSKVSECRIAASPDDVIRRRGSKRFDF
jgi:hypothetical protein